MALNLRDMDSSLQIRFKVGEDDEGKAIFRTRTLNRIRSTISDEDLYSVALALIGLQENQMDTIVRNVQVAYEDA